MTARRPVASPGTGASGPAEIHLAIEELVLEGFDTRDGFDVARAVRDVLTAQLTGSDPARLAEMDGTDRIDAGAVRVPQLTGPAALGTLVGRAVHSAMDGTGDRR